MDTDRLKDAMRRAADWLVDVAQVREPKLTHEDPRHFRYEDWTGAFRGEYRASTRQWRFFCPIWHGSQAVKSLLLAERWLQDERYLHSARSGAQFILRYQVWDPASPDHGLLLAFEDLADGVNTSACLEAMDGLLLLAERDHRPEITQRMIQLGHFLIDKLYMAGQGLFRDVYLPAEHRVMLPNPFRTLDNVGGRPLLDDGIFLKLHRLTGNPRFLEVATETGRRLVADQRPAGNWVDYGPCIPRTMSFHPRHTYWWGLPLIDLWRQTGEQSFWDTAQASAHFSRRAMRHDGGYIRGTYLDTQSGDLTTDSFGHATSGSACAAIFFLAMFEQTRDSSWLEAANRGIEYCINVQLRDTADPNLRGVVLEKVLPPDGTDASPYHVRDLGTIFFLQAAAEYLRLT